MEPLKIGSEPLRGIFPIQGDVPPAENSLSTLELSYTFDELDAYTNRRIQGLAFRSGDWIRRSSFEFWKCTLGKISKLTLDNFRDTVLSKYVSDSSHAKTLSFGIAFLKYLSKLHMDLRFRHFDMFLERPKVLKARKPITSRIVTFQDIQNILNFVNSYEKNGELDRIRANQYTAFVLFGAYTGQRSMATMSKLTVGQVREALEQETPCIRVLSSQDKIRMEHYVPIHPILVNLLSELCNGKQNEDRFFEHNSIWMWMKRQKIPMKKAPGHFVLGDLRKFAAQYGDIIQWDQSNRAYILTHGVSGVDWAHYKHPLPEHVYDVYMKYWDCINLSIT